MNNHKIITLTTDFGYQDEYVGVIKGVILKRTPTATVIDITNSITPHDIREAARIINSSYSWFPKKTVHMVVVDPGVGSNRSILALRKNDHIFVGPDNGVFSLLLKDDHKKEAEIYRVTNKELFLNQVSSTFHGRDIMAPVAALLARGMALHHAGTRVVADQCCRVSLPVASCVNDRIVGEIIHIDHFGNLQTNISSRDLKQVPDLNRIHLSLGDYTITTISHAYTDGMPGTPIALIDSRDNLEIVLNCGNAAEDLSCKRGDPIVVSFAD